MRFYKICDVLIGSTSTVAVILMVVGQYYSFANRIITVVIVEFVRTPIWTEIRCQVLAGATPEAPEVEIHLCFYRPGIAGIDLLTSGLRMRICESKADFGCVSQD